MGKRDYGTGQLYVEFGSYYGRWRTLDGRKLNRKIGKAREKGSAEGLTRSEAERRFRRLQQEEARPRPSSDERRTVDDATDSLRRKLKIEGCRTSYLQGHRVDAASAHLAADRIDARRPGDAVAS